MPLQLVCLRTPPPHPSRTGQNAKNKSESARGSRQRCFMRWREENERNEPTPRAKQGDSPHAPAAGRSSLPPFSTAGRELPGAGRAIGWLGPVAPPPGRLPRLPAPQVWGSVRGRRLSRGSGAGPRTSPRERRVDALAQAAGAPTHRKQRFLTSKRISAGSSEKHPNVKWPC